jgi:hypothetical protein
MLRFLLSLAVAAVVAVAIPAVASARYAVHVGIGDQSVALFDQPLFQQAKIQRVRLFVPWDITRHRSQLADAEAYVRRARAAGTSVLVHISSNDLRERKAHLPTLHAYRVYVGRIVRALRPLGVRDWGAWNEANHPSQPTWDNPQRAARYFEVMRSICKGCTIVALDVLDQRKVDAYIASFYRALPRRLRSAARIVGIHDYGDVNRHKSTGTSGIMRDVRRFSRHARFWLTETGGIVELGKTFRCSTSRAATSTNYLFAVLKKFRHSIDRAYVYNWFGANCRTRMDTGLVNRNGTPRPAYTALRKGLTRFER